MAKVCDLLLDFPDIEGASIWQIRYAENLRKEYISSHIERFKEIEERTFNEIDRWDLDMPNDSNTSILEMDFNDEEVCVLFYSGAGGVIGRLKRYFEKERNKNNE